MNQFNKGLVLDVDPMKQPESTYRYAQNAILTTNSEDMLELSSEYGTTLCASVPSGYTVNGVHVMADDTVVVFSTDGTNSEIGTIIDCTYTTLINDTCLNFNTSYPIVCTSKTINGCERVIIFCDDLNPDKYINIDSLTDYQTGGNWNCNLMQIHPSYTVPNYDDIEVRQTGGVNVALGTYAFSARYLDNSGQPISDWFSPSLVVPVIDENPESVNADGGYNISSGYSVENGAVPTTNKSIDIRFTNVDTSFDRMEIAVIHKTNGDDTTIQVYKLDPINISGSTFTYKYTGNGDSEQITLDEILTPLAKYEKSRFLNQLSNRLLRYNVKEKVRNWADFQREAMDIQVRWVSKNVDPRTQTKADFYRNDRSYMKDEVYALGIVWLFNDGTESPVFHIPGRQKDTYSDSTAIPDSLPNGTHTRPAPNVKWDSTTILASDNNNLYGGDRERWQVYNTAILDNTTASVDHSGELGYYDTSESGFTYPDTQDCNGQYVYGTDGQNQNPIRHHRMPDVTLLRHADNDDTIRVLGLEFNNVNVPTGYSDDVVGWKIVRSIRTEENKTVLDKGIYYGMMNYYQEDGSANVEANFNYQRPRFNGKFGWNYSLAATQYDNLVPLGSDSEELYRTSRPINRVEYVTDYLAFHGAESKFNNYYPNGDYIKLECTINGDITQIDFTEYSDTSGAFGWGDLGKSGHDPFSFIVNYLSYGNPVTIMNRSVDVLANVDFNSRVTIDGTKFINNTQQEYVLIKNDTTNPLPVPEDSDEGTGTDKIVYQTQNDSSSAYYCAIKRLIDVYTNLDDIQYVDTTNNFTGSAIDNGLFWGGDIFISKMRFRQTLDGVRPGKQYGYVRNLNDFFVESTINCTLRHQGLGDNGNKYYPKDWSGYLDYLFLEQFLFSEDLNIDRPYVVYPNYYGYNEDFTGSQIKKRVSLPSTFNWQSSVCSDCAGEFNNRIIYSEPSVNYEQGDSYRTFLYNNYVDIPANTGEIQAAFTIRNDLYVQTPLTIYKHIISPRQLQMNDDTINLGTGTFLSLEPVQLSLASQGGTTSRFGGVYTPFGYFYVDNNGETIYKFGDSLEPVSRNGVHSFMRKNVDYAYNEDVDDTFIQKFTSAYDPFSDRVIISKTDYNPLFTYKTTGYGDGDNAYVDGKFYEVTAGPTLTEMDYEDSSLFEKKSWTISYSLVNNAWSSFHSWIPDWTFNTSRDLYSVKGINVYRHLEDSPYQNYYGTKYDHILEWTKTQLNSITHDITWIGYLDQNGQQINNKWFNSIWAYNRDQSSGKQTIDFSTNPYYVHDPSNPSVTKEESFYNVNDLRSFAIATPVSTSTWSDTEYSTRYTANGYIDKVPKTTSHDTSLSFYEQEYFRRNYLNVRLFFNDASDIKVTTNLTNTTQQQSLR